MGGIQRLVLSGLLVVAGCFPATITDVKAICQIGATRVVDTTSCQLTADEVEVSATVGFSWGVSNNCLYTGAHGFINSSHGTGDELASASVYFSADLTTAGPVRPGWAELQFAPQHAYSHLIAHTPWMEFECEGYDDASCPTSDPFHRWGWVVPVQLGRPFRVSLTAWSEKMYDTGGWFSVIFEFEMFENAPDHYGQPSGPVPLLVIPEPSSYWLVYPVLGYWLVRRRRRRL